MAKKHHAADNASLLKHRVQRLLPPDLFTRSILIMRGIPDGLQTLYKVTVVPHIGANVSMKVSVPETFSYDNETKLLQRTAEYVRQGLIDQVISRSRCPRCEERGIEPSSRDYICERCRYG